MNEHVAITVVRDDQPSLSDNAAALQILSYSSLMLRTFLICILVGVRVHQANQSASENNKVFTIIGFVALYAVAQVGVILLLDHSQPMRRNLCYTILRFIGSFSAFLAPFSLLMVMLLPPKLNWIGYLVVFVMFALIVACFYLDDQQRPKRSSTFNDLAISFVFFLNFAGFMLPDSIVFPLIYVSLWMEAVFHFTTYLMFIYQKTRKPNNSEAYSLIQDDENNDHPQIHYCTYLMQIGS